MYTCFFKSIYKINSFEARPVSSWFFQNMERRSFDYFGLPWFPFVEVIAVINSQLITWGSFLPKAAQKPMFFYSDGD